MTDGSDAGGEPLGLTGYLAPEGALDALLEELGEAVEEVHGRLVLARAPTEPPAWAANVWYDPVAIPITSIKDGARRLRALQRGWALYPVRLHRRARLLEEQLPHVSAKPLAFPQAPPRAPLGSWTLRDARTILAAPRCSSPFPHGVARFVEDREGPPSRAYLKLWEAWTRLEAWPAPGERCLDLGASPGGWTWACAQLGADVVGVDKAPLVPELERHPRVEHLRRNAFALEPRDVGPVDWLLSDVACYPTRLLGLVERWLDSGLARNYVCTIKLQGATDHAAARAFARLPGGRVVHLHHNRHELTWMRPAVAQERSGR